MSKEYKNLKSEFLIKNINTLLKFIFNKLKIIIIILSILSIIYIFNSTFGGNYIQKSANKITNTFYYVISYPIYYINDKYNEITNFFINKYCNTSNIQSIKYLYGSENAKEYLSKLEFENITLKNELKYKEAYQNYDYISAKILNISSNLFENSMMLNIGQKDGIKVGSAVTHYGKLIGRIESVNDTSAKVLLITSDNFKVPAVFLKSGEKCIISGNYISNIIDVIKNTTNTHLKIMYIDNIDKITEGDIVVTSGENGVVPYGIEIGATRISKKGDINNINNINNINEDGMINDIFVEMSAKLNNMIVVMVYNEK